MSALYYDSSLHADLLPIPEAVALEYSRMATGHAAPLWVSCPVCGAYRGDPCREHRLDPGLEYCRGRVMANWKRLWELPTHAVPIKTPCHQREVWLLWRSADTQLCWEGVPCTEPGCDNTFTIEKHVGELLSASVQSARIWPRRVQMTCWALDPCREDSDDGPA